MDICSRQTVRAVARRTPFDADWRLLGAQSHIGIHLAGAAGAQRCCE